MGRAHGSGRPPAQRLREASRLFLAAARRCRIRFARSSSRRRVAESPLPPRLMKYWIMRTADPTPFGETSLRAVVRAIWDADPAKVRLGGCVGSVVSCLTQRRTGRPIVVVSEHTP